MKSLHKLSISMVLGIAGLVHASPGMPKKVEILSSWAGPSMQFSMGEIDITNFVPTEGCSSYKSALFKYTGALIEASIGDQSYVLNVDRQLLLSFKNNCTVEFSNMRGLSAIFTNKAFPGVNVELFFNFENGTVIQSQGNNRQVNGKITEVY